MTASRLVPVAFGLLTVALVSRADDPPMKHGFRDLVHKGADGKEVKYVLFVPRGHDAKADKTYPVILFLHGAGETKGGQKQPAEVGIGPAIKKREKTFPFLTVIPQAQTRGWQADGPNAAMALAILDGVMKEYKGDPKRVYLTGLSMGGFGSWSLAAKHPERWAAVAPVCGGVRQGAGETAKAMKDVPCWCFHGGADAVVPAKLSRDLIKALWAAGAAPNYTEYPGVGHNSWDKAYGTDDLYEWFLANKRK